MTDPLFVDLYAGDMAQPNWSKVSERPEFFGAILKATEGLYYFPTWFKTNWSLVGSDSLTGREYGKDWFRGAYHFLKFDQDGKAQADFYLKAVDAAGGWEKGDLWPIVDVELGGEKNSNQNASAAQIIDCTSAWAEQVKAQTSRQVMLYGNGAMRDRNITDRMGCDWLWLPRYTATLPSEIYERAGWSLDQLVLWQYCGDGVAYLEGYPKEVPEFGKVDISALVLTGGIEKLRSLL